MVTKNSLRISEHSEQKNLIQWAKFSETAIPELKMLFAIPSGGARHIVVARKLKAEGVKPGIPDLMLPVARGGYHGLFIEMKAATKGRTSPKQREWIFALDRQGYRVVVCKGFDAAKGTVLEYLEAGE